MRASPLRGVFGIIGVGAALALMELTFTPAPGATEETRNSLTCLSNGSKAEQPLATPTAEAAARLRLGGSIYRQYCLACHGEDGTGSNMRRHLPPIPDFTSPAWHKERTDARLMVSILHGKGTFMIAHNSRLTQEQTGCLVAYIRAFQLQSDNGGANAQRGKKPAQGETLEQRLRPLERAQLEWLELQKKHIDEQLLEQIQQLEQDTKKQITQLRHQARRQTELLDIQKRLYLAQVESQLAAMASPAANVAGRSPAISPAIAEKLDKILDRLESIEKRLQRLEKGTPRRRDK